MIELFDTSPDANVQPVEFQRLLGFPRDKVVEGRALELTQWAREWYERNGHPWVYVRHAKNLASTNGSILIDGTSFSSKRLARTLRQAESQDVILAAVSAGPEIETEAQQAWREEKPDEYFYLEMYGSAVVEHLVTMTGARLCEWAEQRGMAVLPHDSPGYSEWDITDQPHLLNLITSRGSKAPTGRLEVLESGMLRPKKSLLAVFGLTRRMDQLRRLTDLIPCESCSFGPCQFRRVPYAGRPNYSSPEFEAQQPAEPSRKETSPLDVDAAYTLNTRALRRWAAERLSIQQRDDGTIDAQFRYDGTTCTNMGHALTFTYQVTLGSRQLGYPILHQECAPVAGDVGHTLMCSYLKNSRQIMNDIERDKPLLGKPLNSVLSWSRPTDLAGCYCEASSRLHKWGLVLQTIHYALVQQEKSQA